ncbi:MAG: type II secretion system secretin GspD [Pseudomonadota bacterium]
MLNLRQWPAAALIACAVLAGTPAFAAPQVSEEAALNFVGADLESVIKAIGHYTNITFVIDPRVKGTINLVSEKPLSKSQAFSLLTSTLRLQGYAVVMGDGFAKVVPEADAKLQPTPVQTVASPIKGDQIATQVFRLNYESSTNMATVLRPLISPNNTINANPGNNSVVITDYADNLKRLGKIIAALDAPSNGDLDVVPLNYAIATDLAAMINRLLEPSSPDSGRVSVMADARTNTLILRAPSLARANLAKSLIAKLDQPTANPGNVHVVYLKNAEAVKLAQTLRAVISSDTSSAQSSSSSSGLASNGNGSNQPAGMPSTAALQPSSAPAALPSGGAAGFIQADPSTNTLIITANEAVYRNLRTVIDLLDVRRAQVYIEAMIVEVTADKAAEFGVQWAAASGSSTSNYRVGGANLSALAGDNNLIKLTGSKGLTAGPGLSIGVFRQINGALGLGAIAHALENDGSVNILSTPNLITLDNEEARIIVGQNVPFITGQYTTAASGSSANPFQTIERKDVGLSLKVRPQISEGGTVKMSIYQESSSVDITAVNAAGIITKKRSIETNVLADDGQIVVLGGLIEDTTVDGVESVRGLADIPIIGNLFKYRKRSRGKTNLMVFLRPTVIRNSEQSNNVLNDRYDFIRGIQTNTQPEHTVFLPDLSNPIIGPLNNGRPIGGNLINNVINSGVPLGNTSKPVTPNPGAVPESVLPPQ